MKKRIILIMVFMMLLSLKAAYAEELKINRQVFFDDFENGINYTTFTADTGFGIVDWERDTEHGKVLCIPGTGTKAGGTRFTFEETNPEENVLVEYEVYLENTGSMHEFSLYDIMLMHSNSKFVANTWFNRAGKLVLGTKGFAPDYSCQNTNTETSNYVMGDYEMGGWHNVKILINRDNTSVDVYFNDVPTVTTPEYELDDDSLTMIIFRQFAPSSGKENSGTLVGDFMYIDNLRVGYMSGPYPESVKLLEGENEYELSDAVTEKADRIKVQFSKDVDAASLNEYSVRLTSDGKWVKTKLDCYDITSKTAEVIIEDGLAGGCEYKVSINGVRDLTGKECNGHEFYFTTDGTKEEAKTSECIAQYASLYNKKLLLNGRADDSVDLKVYDSEKALVASKTLDKDFTYTLELSDYGRYFIELSSGGLTESISVFESEDVCIPTVKLTSKNIGNIFFNDEPKFFTVEASGAGFEDNAQIWVDVWNEETGKAVNAYSAYTKKRSGKYELRIDLDEFGLYEMNVTVKNADTGAKTVIEGWFSGVNGCQNGVTNPKSGICAHYDHGDLAPYGEVEFDLMKKAGFSINRGSVSWSSFEKAQGVYELTSNRREWLEFNRKRGTDMTCGLLYSNSVRTTENPPRSAEALGYFADYVYNVVLQTKDYLNKYEVWNEYNCEGGGFNPDCGTPQDYVNMLQYTYKAAKKANEECIIYGCVAANIVIDQYGPLDILGWIDSVFDLGGGEYMDGVSIHPYQVFLSPEEYDVVSLIKKVRAIMDEHGYEDMPIFVSEYGWTSGVCSKREQAAYELRGAALLYNDVETVCWYVLNEKNNQSYRENKFGMINSYGVDTERPFAAKPAYLAMANMNRLVSGAERSDNLASDGIYDFEFTRSDGGIVRMIWTSGSECEYIAVSDKKELVLVDMYGNESEISSDDGNYTVSISGEPIYLYAPPKAQIFAVNRNGAAVKSMSDIVTVDQTLHIDERMLLVDFETEETTEFISSGNTGIDVFDSGEEGYGKVLRLIHENSNGSIPSYTINSLNSQHKKVVVSFDMKLHQEGISESGKDVISVVLLRSCTGGNGYIESGHDNKNMVLHKNKFLYMQHYSYRKSILEGQWHKVQYLFDYDEKKVYMYIDGVLIEKGDLLADVDHFAKIYIQAFARSGWITYYDNFEVGTYDEDYEPPRTVKLTAWGDASLVGALYNGQKLLQLVKADTADKKAELELSVDGIDSIKGFVWDSMNTMRPFTDAINIE